MQPLSHRFRFGSILPHTPISNWNTSWCLMAVTSVLCCSLARKLYDIANWFAGESCSDRLLKPLGITSVYEALSVYVIEVMVKQ